MTDEPQKRKLIEVSLPLEAINRESAREKYIFKGNPASLHKWWSRKPLATARAVLFAQLVDDPSSHPDRFPNQALVQEERERLHGIIERLVVWENVHKPEVLREAQEEILEATNGDPPPILDPFAGGGTIPLEAQRLGLETRASDLNPVAVLINKALIEIPPEFAGRQPVFPGLADTEIANWSGVAGLAADVCAYGEWVREEAQRRVGSHYPKARLADGTEATAIAWIWARTVTCPNPACRIEMPLVKTWWVGSRKGNEAYVEPRVVDAADHPSGKRIEFTIRNDPAGPSHEPTKVRQGAVCVACGGQTTQNHIKAEGQAGRMGTALLAVVAETDRGRVYQPPSDLQLDASLVSRPDIVPDQEISHEPRSLSAPAFGVAQFADLFTDRQLLVLDAFADLVGEARERVTKDGGSQGYANAVATYLTMALSKMTDYVNSFSAWYPKENRPTHLFTGQAIPMIWNFAELNPLCDIGGSWARSVRVVGDALRSLDPRGDGEASQIPANAVDYAGAVLSTDPPYYDYIGYSDLSDFFYVWLRRSLKDAYPTLLSTVLVPKAEELVANPQRHDGKDGAKRFFERGFREVFASARRGALLDFPITVYYAFKQSDADEEGEASTGWETLLEGMVGSGWVITATWPMRSERGGRSFSIGTNALASSIVLALRPRPDDAPTADRREFIEALRNELPGRLRELQHGQIAPVDLPQAAIGPGMAMFSRYAAVIEPDGSQMRVRAALARINEVLDEVLNEQEGDFDTTTRFALAWYRQHGYEKGKFGDANTLANARNTSVEAMDRAGVLGAAVGEVKLFSPVELEAGYDPAADERISAWEVLHHMIRTVESEGIAVAGELLNAAGARSDDPVDADLVKELAFLLFSIAEKSGWTQDALAFNSLATAWPDIVDAMRDGSGSQDQQASLDI